jgi:hypothetical protein
MVVMVVSMMWDRRKGTHHPPGPCGDVPSGLHRATAA